MRIGCRAHDFGRLELGELVDRIAGAGFASAQLALGKALIGAPGPGGLDAAWARGAAGAFSRRGVAIAVLGCYINPIHPDPAERARGLARFKEHLRVARDFGAAGGGAPLAAAARPGTPLPFPVVATETGSLNADCSWHPGNSGDLAFGLLVDALAEIAEAAEAAGSIACVEGVVRHVASTPARLRALLDAVGSRSLMVLFDPVNFLDAGNCAAQDRMLDEAFDCLGDRILVVHAKDFIIEGGELAVCPPGRGSLAYPRLMRFLRERMPGADILIEDLKPADMPAARRFVQEAYEGAPRAESPSGPASPRPPRA